MATNAIMTRSGAKTGIITTSGFEDIIAIVHGISKWFGLPEAATRKPPAIVPKGFIERAIKRIDRDGEVVYPLNHTQTRQSIQRLIDKVIEGLAVSFLWAPKNPAHEREIARMVREMAPDLYVSVSSTTRELTLNRVSGGHNRKERHHGKHTL